MTVVYEDNHIIIVNKTASEIVQGDKTGRYTAFGNCKAVPEREVQQAWKCLYRCRSPAGPPRERSCCFCQDQ